MGKAIESFNEARKALERADLAYMDANIAIIEATKAVEISQHAANTSVLAATDAINANKEAIKTQNEIQRLEKSHGDLLVSLNEINHQLDLSLERSRNMISLYYHMIRINGDNRNSLKSLNNIKNDLPDYLKQLVDDVIVDAISKSIAQTFTFEFVNKVYEVRPEYEFLNKGLPLEELIKVYNNANSFDFNKLYILKEVRFRDDINIHQKLKFFVQVMNNDPSIRATLLSQKYCVQLLSEFHKFEKYPDEFDFSIVNEAYEMYKDKTGAE